MTQTSALPDIQLTPLHAAVAQGRTSTLDILITLTPPQVEIDDDRPPINLGLVLDRSGSMHGNKIVYARQAACFAVEQLLPSDRVSITLFDTKVKVLVPSTLATDKQAIIRQIQQITPGASTALHDGWVEGSMQVSQFLDPTHLNRVLLLSDGLANVGKTNPDAIAQDVRGLCDRGVSTSTLGVGRDYNEDLMEAMARSGDGNFYHIESPEQLPEIFQVELQGLAATLGRNVTLQLTPTQGAVVKDVLNDFDQTDTGAHKLPNLVLESPIQVVMRLQVPALSETASICDLTLRWTDEAGEPQTSTVSLTLPVVPPEQLSDFPANPQVDEQVALLMAARARKEAIDFIDRGDMVAARSSLSQVRHQMSAMPASPMMEAEIQNLVDLEDVMLCDRAMSRKRAKYEQYFYQQSRPLQSRSRRKPPSPESPSADNSTTEE